MRTAPQVAYVIWIGVSTIGLLQAFASYYGWVGLSFFRTRPRLGYLCAAVLIPVSYYWFFSLTDRNVPGLEGWQLFSRFVIGIAAGLVTVLVVSSVVNDATVSKSNRTRPRHSQAPPGLDALREDTFLRLLSEEIRHSPPLRLLRAVQHGSWTRAWSLLRHLSTTPPKSQTSVVASDNPRAAKGRP